MYIFFNISFTFDSYYYYSYILDEVKYFITADIKKQLIFYKLQIINKKDHINYSPIVASPSFDDSFQITSYFLYPLLLLRDNSLVRNTVNYDHAHINYQNTRDSCAHNFIRVDAIRDASGDTS